MTRDVSLNEVAAPMLRHLNLKVVRVEQGESEVHAVPTRDFDNPMGRTHGGYAAAVIDTAMGAAVHTCVDEGIQFGTIDLSVKFVRRIDTDTGMLLAHGKVLHRGRTMLTAEARIVDSAGKLYAHGTGTFLVYPKQ
jgi:acyl-CoA thioesterase